MLGGMTYGGYSTSIVVDEDFVLQRVRASSTRPVPPRCCAPASPRGRRSGTGTWGPGSKVGVVGLGGLGHMGVKLAHALGAHVVLFTGSPGKTADARRLGADEVVVTRNADEMAKQAGSLDFILNTVSAQHNLDVYLNLLKRDGTMCLVGVPEHAHPSPNVGALIFKRRSLAGSLIGGIRETQEMLDFCAEHDIVSDVEVIPMQKINEAYERMLKSDVKYRFVIDMASIK